MYIFVKHLRKWGEANSLLAIFWKRVYNVFVTGSNFRLSRTDNKNCSFSLHTIPRKFCPQQGDKLERSVPYEELTHEANFCHADGLSDDGGLFGRLYTAQRCAGD
jgi:hypothetical protein